MKQSIGPSTFANLRATLLDDPFAWVDGKPPVTADGGAPLSATRVNDGGAFARPFAGTIAGTTAGLTDDAPSRRPDRLKGFLLHMDDGEPLVCSDVRGFREAMVASIDARAPVPSRLEIVAQEGGACAWIEAWAEDGERVRRTLTIVRRFDGKSFTAIVTLCSFGHGVETSLCVESVFAPRVDPKRRETMGTGAPKPLGADAVLLSRSGVFLRADIEAALARYDAEAQEDDGSLAANPRIPPF